MNAQARDLAAGMTQTGGLATHCGLCEVELTDQNKLSPFATVCARCARQIEDDEREAANNAANFTDYPDGWDY